MEQKYKIQFRGREIEIERLPNGKFRVPDFIKKFKGAFSGAQLKPALEVILCVMRPLSEKTYIDQALANGHGVSWLDDARIPWESDGDMDEAGRSSRGKQNQGFGTGNLGRSTRSQGRFPANLICEDDVLNDGKVIPPSGNYPRKRNCRRLWGTTDNRSVTGGYSDSGSFSRYFSLDQWSTKNLPESAQRTFPFLIVPKASKREKNAGLDELPEKPAAFNGPHRSKNTTGSGKPQKPIKHKNDHPCVKPIKLMSWLITIGSRPDDVILDPFVGSGTTCIAAAILGRRYIGMDLDEYNVDISRRRIKWHVEQMAKDELAQLTFDWR